MMEVNKNTESGKASGKTPCYTPEELAREAYKITHEAAPPDVPRWEELHRVERSYLIKFAAQIVKLVSV